MRRALRWGLTVTVALAVFIVAALVTNVLLHSGPLAPPREPSRPSTRPQENPTSSYTVELSVNGEAFMTVTIGSQGESCELMQAVVDAYRTCVIARNLIPSHIGGEAYGELNLRRTPAYDALVWRARVNADAGVCTQGGLEGSFLAACQGDAADPSYEYAMGNLRVRVPLGGAAPSPVAT